ncbi:MULTISPECIES: hypothetical protein [unclassified Microcoleus]|uniref:hypothetical protein n=1 Tax=unclassified Microcoleus TaxID=2642155 RepID=UPI002FD263F0
MEDFDPKRCAAELNNIKSVQVTLSGWEIYCLVAGAQFLKAANTQHPNFVETAETAAKRMCNSLDSPLAREHLAKGWKLVGSQNFPLEDFPPEAFPPESFNL